MGIKKRARKGKARRSQKLIVGPWIHGPANIDNQSSGDFDFGSDAALNIDDLRLP